MSMETVSARPHRWQTQGRVCPKHSALPPPCRSTRQLSGQRCMSATERHREPSRTPVSCREIQVSSKPSLGRREPNDRESRGGSEDSRPSKRQASRRCQAKSRSADKRRGEGTAGVDIEEKRK